LISSETLAKGWYPIAPAKVRHCGRRVTSWFRQERAAPGSVPPRTAGPATPGPLHTGAWCRRLRPTAAPRITDGPAPLLGVRTVIRSVGSPGCVTWEHERALQPLHRPEPRAPDALSDGASLIINLNVRHVADLNRYAQVCSGSCRPFLPPPHAAPRSSDSRGSQRINPSFVPAGRTSGRRGAGGGGPRAAVLS
jgi:hypothetical protein